MSTPAGLIRHGNPNEDGPGRMTPRKLLAVVGAIVLVALGCLVFKTLTGSDLLDRLFVLCMVAAPLILGIGIGRWGIRR